MVRITVDDNLCKGCGLCARNCPKKIIDISKTVLNAKGYRPAEITDTDACIACAACARTCPDIAIRIEKD
ncbi:MAG: 4Fe-4S binding protein [Oscillospiraceae bacterium]|nr:4Fe-4S binding protein [Oscillospiraceae bacterium]